MDQDETRRILSLMRQSEHHGELVLRQRAELVHMDLASNKNREALNAIRRRPAGESVYLCTGNMFMKLPKAAAIETLEKDQKEIAGNVEKLRKEVDKNVKMIQTIEGKGERFQASYGLNPMSKQEMKGIDVILGQIKKIDL